MKISHQQPTANNRYQSQKDTKASEEHKVPCSAALTLIIQPLPFLTLGLWWKDGQQPQGSRSLKGTEAQGYKRSSGPLLGSNALSNCPRAQRLNP